MSGATPDRPHRMAVPVAPLTIYLEGQPHPDGRRLTGVQRCLRTTDLDEVGDRTRLTVFEMLGSWSLGDYSGSQGLRWGHELITGAFGIGPICCTPPCSAAATR